MQVIELGNLQIHELVEQIGICYVAKAVLICSDLYRQPSVYLMACDALGQPAGYIDTAQLCDTEGQEVGVIYQSSSTYLRIGGSSTGISDFLVTRLAAVRLGSLPNSSSYQSWHYQWQSKEVQHYLQNSGSLIIPS